MFSVFAGKINYMITKITRYCEMARKRAEAFRELVAMGSRRGEVSAGDALATRVLHGGRGKGTTTADYSALLAQVTFEFESCVSVC